MSEREKFEYVQWAVKEMENMGIKEIRDHYCEVIEVFCKQGNATLAEIELFRCIVNSTIAEKERQSISA